MKQMLNNYTQHREMKFVQLKIGSVGIEVLFLIPFLIMLFPAGLRAVLGGAPFRAINVLVWMALLPYMLKYKKFKRMNVGVVSVAILCIFQVITENTVHEGALFVFLNCCSSVLPIILIYMYFDADEFFHKLFFFWCKALEVATIIIFVFGVIDIIANKSGSQFFADLYGTRSYYALIREGRMVSFYGHTVSTASMISLYFFSSVIGHRLKILKGKESYCMILACIAMAMTSSKAGFLILMLGILVTNFGIKRIRYILCFIIAVYVAYMLGFLDTLLVRINESLVSGDITTGRNTAMKTLVSAGILKYNFWHGQGIPIGTWDYRLIAALEYPLLRMAFMHGIVYAIIYGCSAFVIPIIRLFRRKQYMILICFILFIIQINTFDGIASNGDMMMIYSMFACILYNLSINNKAIERK